MRLTTMAALLGAEKPLHDCTIDDLCYDSRQVVPATVFFCLRGAAVDGHRFAAKAVAAGACALVVEERLAEIDAAIPQFLVADSRRALARVAEAFFGYPHRELTVIGVTGTNGKTTTTHLIRHVLEKHGCPTGLIGTNYVWDGSQRSVAGHTTPESYEISRYLRRMVDNGCRAVVMEVSSHGLKQGRVSALAFQVAVFTNLSQDHLDYHITFDDYLKAKLLLFQQLTAGATAVVNGDDVHAADVIAACPVGVNVRTYGFGESVAYRAVPGEPAAGGFRLCHDGQTYDVCLPLLGRFNIYNGLAALAALASLPTISLTDLCSDFGDAAQVSGRFENVTDGEGPTVIVDYAHSPDGLANILPAAAGLKSTPGATLCLVFGCGGDRDRGKRPLMGKIAGERADFSIITSDNPRSEDPLAIIEMIEAGMAESGGEYVVLPDRHLAIRLAVLLADDDDIVVIAGKGHEDYQIIGKETVHFDDREEARAALAVWRRVKGAARDLPSARL